jgi:O-antigen ligase
MGLFFTILYIIFTIIGLEQFGQEWAGSHILQYVAALTVLASIPNILANSNLWSSVQTYLMLALITATGLSQVMNGWLGGIIYAWSKFLPSAAVYFFIVANVTTLRKLKIATLATVAACIGVAVESLIGYYSGFQVDTFVLKQNLYAQEQIVGQLLRVRAVGFLHDPNDFAQMLLIALCFIFVAWQRRKLFMNSVIVLIPATALLWTIYLTHSRGALIALITLSLFAARRRISKTKSLVLTAGLVTVALGLNFMGGRVISASEGSDRLEAWATGLELFKSAPIFGIGFGSFTDFNNITAHNSLVLCLAELGMVGATIWLGLLVITIMSLNDLLGQEEPPDQFDPNESNVDTTSDLEANGSQLYSTDDNSINSNTPNCIAPAKTKEERTLVYVGSLVDREDDLSGLSGSVVPDDQFLSTPDVIAAPVRSIENENVPKGWIEAVHLATITFVTTSWFLSRSYDIPMYLVLGLATAAINIQSSGTSNRNRSRWLPYTLVTEVTLIFIIYFLVRLRQ